MALDSTAVARTAKMEEVFIVNVWSVSKTNVGCINECKELDVEEPVAQRGVGSLLMRRSPTS